MADRVYIAGTVDTKAAELLFLRSIIRGAGLDAVIADLSTTSHFQAADIPAAEVAAWHPDGPSAVFTGDRGTAVAAMGTAFERFMAARPDVLAALGIGGSGGTAMVAAGLRTLPVGIPKLLVSTVASGQVAGYVGPSDMAMMYSVTDLAGLNRISRTVLSNAAHAVIGMARGRLAAAEGPDEAREAKPAIGLTMFGVTTPCIRQLTDALAERFDCLTFHATGTGGQSMEKLVDSGLLGAVLDITTTEVCDLLMGGIFPCTEDRFGAIARTRTPYVGSCGALDMVNFGPPETVPRRYADRLFYRHNPQVTLMRTTPDENARMGAWIGERLNRCEGPVRFLMPERGVSLLDAPGQPFFDPAADAALFEALDRTVVQTPRRHLVRVPHAISNPPFAAAVLAHLDAVMSES